MRRHNLVLILQVIGEMTLDHPVQALDYTGGGHMIAVSGGGTKIKTAKLS